ncbi:hypothetical protein A3A40_00260 [Candidatus Kaiserbacteria bacterium RIFCSPLOWO2_01_FULL_54_20]|uniref:Uncharacterized protein n=1 Tax=Candidatus Kaiserbacteria bacterium RIFCSPLOWO2_01_FULL_54_20 TaxID=1798513 RepID=A0A1F6EJL2_9BACT|nr:MAG: hypothetical protein A3A40_00260 [Candidatus Kaiserbacteria bacterium RIFCSPLOWO2_01_FULL_54_20]
MNQRVARRLALKGFPENQEDALKHKLNGTSSHQFDIKFEPGEPFVIEGMIEVCEFTGPELLPIVGEQIEAIVGPEYVVCCSMSGRPDVYWKSANARPCPSGW